MGRTANTEGLPESCPALWLGGLWTRPASAVNVALRCGQVSGIKPEVAREMQGLSCRASQRSFVVMPPNRAVTGWQHQTLQRAMNKKSDPPAASGFAKSPTGVTGLDGQPVRP